MNHNSVFLSYPNSNEDFALKPHAVKVPTLLMENHEAAKTSPENDIRNSPNNEDANLSGDKEGNSRKDRLNQKFSPLQEKKFEIANFSLQIGLYVNFLSPFVYFLN